MQAVKIVALCLVCLMVALAVIGLFTPGEYEVVRQTVIQAPRDTVFAFLRMLKNQERFSVWADMDPAMERDYRGTDGTVGFVMAWRSQNEDIGSGEQEIIHIAEGERITVKDLPAHITHRDAGEGDMLRMGRGMSLRESVRAFEYNLIMKTIEDTGGDRRAAARKLGIGLSTLYRKIEEFEHNRESGNATMR